MSGAKGVVGPVAGAAVESEREKRLLEICVKAWRRHLQELAERKDKGAA